jgi:hypothetical protein
MYQNGTVDKVALTKVQGQIRGLRGLGNLGEWKSVGTDIDMDIVCMTWWDVCKAAAERGIVVRLSKARERCQLWYHVAVPDK